MVVVVKSGNMNNSCFPCHTFSSSAFSSSPYNTTASHLYMKHNAIPLKNITEWRNKLFVKVGNGSDGSYGKTKCCRGEKEIKNDILDIDQSVTNPPEKSPDTYLDVDKVINTLSSHLEKILCVERKEKMIDKKKGDIIYQTKDGRVLQAFHSCEWGKIIWDDNVYDDLKAWLAAATSVVAMTKAMAVG